MAESEAAICNVALARVGHTLFIDTLDDATTEAEICKRLYPACRDELLELVDWPFARRRYFPSQITATTLDSGDVPTGWGYAFALPSDAIPNGIRSIETGIRRPRPDQAAAFDIEYDNKTQQDILLCDVETPEFRYTMRLTDMKRFPPSFDSALAWRLAIDLVLPLRKDAATAARVQTSFAQAMVGAAAAAKQGVQIDPEPTPSHITARG